MIGRFFFNPAFVVTAAFIGPGTITMCILTGTNYGFDLLWAVLCSTLITIFIQNIAARISFYSKKGLAQRLKAEGDKSPADVILTVDIGRLYIYDDLDLLAPINSKKLLNNIAHCTGKTINLITY